MKFISLKTAEIQYGDRATCLKEIKPGLWEWDAMAFDEKRRKANGKQLDNPEDGMQLTVPYNLLEKEGLESYIKVIQKILDKASNKEKEFGTVKWKTNAAKVKISCGKDKDGDFWISFKAQNKYRKNFVYAHEQLPGGTEYIPEIHDDIYGTSESWGGNTLLVTENDLKQYIKDLQEELASCSDSGIGKKKKTSKK